MFFPILFLPQKPVSRRFLYQKRPNKIRTKANASYNSHPIMRIFAPYRILSNFPVNNQALFCYNSPTMALKSAYSDISIDKIFAELQKTLGQHGAKQISYDYGDDGRVQGVQFVIKVNDRFLPVRLPARVEKAQAVLKRQWDAGIISHKRAKEKTYGDEQAYRVAWKNILEWTQAQMALIEIEMAKLEEIFLPYMVDRSGKTYFETLEKRQFQLESGDTVEDAEVIHVG